MSDTDFKEMVIRILSDGWNYCGQPLDTTKLEKRLENERFLKKNSKNKLRMHIIDMVLVYTIQYIVYSDIQKS